VHEPPHNGSEALNFLLVIRKKKLCVPHSPPMEGRHVAPDHIENLKVEDRQPHTLCAPSSKFDRRDPGAHVLEEVSVPVILFLQYQNWLQIAPTKWWFSYRTCHVPFR